MKCVLCNNEITEFGEGIYYLEDNQFFLVPFNYCEDCDCFIRKIDTKQVCSHLKNASYTNINNEKRFFNERINFFKYLHTLAGKNSKSINKWLDFGCSYGHLLEYIKGLSIDCVGVELSKQVREYAQSKNVVVYEKIEKIPKNERFDVISLIDSIYYSASPIELLTELNAMLNPNGILIMRVTNRNWLAKIRKKYLNKEIGLSLGDATISYSNKSISILLKKTGFDILYFTSIEKGKSIAIKTKIFYLLTSILYVLTFRSINISPGIIVIAKKSTHNTL